jgi:DNA invertase Pin-like site-specific DNA recombinase
VFELLDKCAVPWVLLENVPFMLQLDKGSALATLVEDCEKRGYRWAYRVVNSHAFLPQRRERVLLLATRTDCDPANVLLVDEVEPLTQATTLQTHAHGFYWTEGIRGLGWAPYARVSTIDQDLTVQREALKRAGCTIIRAEKMTGTKLSGRSELRTLLDFIRRDDTVVVTRVDRLARSIGDLAAIVREIDSKGAALKATEQPIDTSTAAGKAFLGMLGVFAEFETDIRKERQMEGIAKAKAEGLHKGRKPSIDRAELRRLQFEGPGATEIAKRLGIARASVYRLLEAAAV